MKKWNAMKAPYHEATFQGQPVLYIPVRIAPTTVPEGLFRYEMNTMSADGHTRYYLKDNMPHDFAGTILTRTPIQLDVFGTLWFEERDFYNLQKKVFVKITDYLAKYPPAETDVIRIRPVKSSERKLLYSQTEEQDRKNGCVGHLRGDFGSGKEFYTTWWPHQEDRLNQDAFRTELDQVVNWLKGMYGPLEDLKSMSSFCFLRGDKAKINADIDTTYGYSVETNRFQYMLRCFPHRGDYNFYLYCYDKEERAKERVSTRSKKKSEPER